MGSRRVLGVLGGPRRLGWKLAAAGAVALLRRRRRRGAAPASDVWERATRG